MSSTLGWMILETCPDVEYHPFMLDVLPHLPLFLDLEPAHAAALKRLFEPYTCAANAMIFQKGEPATHLYLIIKGKAAIQYKPYDGPPIILTRLREKDIFGWSAVVGNGRYTSTIFSETPLESIRIQGTDVLRLIDNNPLVGRTILDRLANMVSPRWVNAHAQIESLVNKKSNREAKPVPARRLVGRLQRNQI